MTAALAEGLRFVGDDEARPAGAAHPLGSLWDDDADPVAELRRMMEVRRAAVSRFGPRALYPGEPVSNLRRKFVPIWLLHRYQVEAAAKLIGGVDFAYSRNGDGQEAARVVARGPRSARALDALLDTLSPEALTVPAALLPYLSAGWSGNPDRQETIEIFRAAGGNDLRSARRLGDRGAADAEQPARARPAQPAGDRSMPPTARSCRPRR